MSFEVANFSTLQLLFLWYSALPLRHRFQSLKGRVWRLLALVVCSQMTFKSNPRSAYHVAVRAGHFCTSSSCLKTRVPISLLSCCPFINPLLSSLAFKDFNLFMDGSSSSIQLQSLILLGLWMDEALFEVPVQSVLVSFTLATLCSLIIFQLGIFDLFW